VDSSDLAFAGLDRQSRPARSAPESSSTSSSSASSGSTRPSTKDDVDVAGEVTAFGTDAHGPAATGDAEVVRVAAEQHEAVESTAELLRSLGHEVVERDVAAELAHPERLSRRTRGYVRLGGLVPRAALARIHRAEAADRARLNRSFDEGVEVLLTPVFTREPLRIGEYDGRGTLWTFSGTARWVPHLGVFNHTGQPAAAVPAGFSRGGLPLSVQLAGPPDAEPALLSLAAQIEAARPWAARRPPLAA
jgi:amidase